MQTLETMLPERPLKKPPLQELLCEKLDFTMEDVAANQQGTITPQQVARLEARIQRNNRALQHVALIFGAAVMLLVSGVVLATSQSFSLISLFVAWIVLLPGVLFMFGMAWLIQRTFGRQTLQRIHAQQFETVEGRVRLYRTWSGAHRQIQFVLSVGDTGFGIGRQTCQQLLDAGLQDQQAVAYYVRGANRLVLSIILR